MANSCRYAQGQIRIVQYSYLYSLFSEILCVEIKSSGLIAAIACLTERQLIEATNTAQIAF